MYKEINIEKIKTLEKDLIDTIIEIKSMLEVKEEIFLKDKKSVFALRYLLIEAIEAMASIGNHILTRIKGMVPRGYPDCFEKLAEGELISHELGNKLKKLASLRNIIIHKYWAIDDSKVFK